MKKRTIITMLLGAPVLIAVAILAWSCQQIGGGDEESLPPGWVRISVPTGTSSARAITSDQAVSGINYYEVFFWNDATGPGVVDAGEVYGGKADKGSNITVSMPAATYKVLLLAGQKSSKTLLAWDYQPSVVVSANTTLPLILKAISTRPLDTNLKAYVNKQSEFAGLSLSSTGTSDFYVVAETGESHSGDGTNGWTSADATPKSPFAATGQSVAFSTPSLSTPPSGTTDLKDSEGKVLDDVPWYNITKASNIAGTFTINNVPPAAAFNGTTNVALTTVTKKIDRIAVQLSSVLDTPAAGDFTITDGMVSGSPLPNKAVFAFTMDTTAASGLFSLYYDISFQAFGSANSNSSTWHIINGFANSSLDTSTNTSPGGGVLITIENGLAASVDVDVGLGI